MMRGECRTDSFTRTATVGLVVKRWVKRTARGKLRRFAKDLTFDCSGVFDIPYRRKLHRRFVLDEIHFLLRFDQTSFMRKCKHEKAQQWLEAIQRDAPFLKGFFADEPEWRVKLLRWCDKVLATPRK
jgi:hypothetical protein